MDNSQATVPSDHIANLAVAGVETRIIEDVPHVILPPGHSLQSFEGLLPKPLRLKEHLKIQNVVSFVDYFHLFSNDATIIFANEYLATITAVFDYHQPKNPSHCEHKATLELTHSDEWKAWLHNNGKALTQRQMAEFIEDNIKDVVTPDGATLLEIAKTLQATKKLAFRSSQELHNGQVQLTYNEEIDGQAGATGQLQIPKGIVLGLRVYKGQEGYQVPARLRYRIADNGILSFSYHIDNVEKILEDAFATVLQQVKANCKATGYILA